MPATYEKIATTTLGSAAATIDFTSIGSGYTDLRLILVGTHATGSANVRMRFNSDTASNYSSTQLIGDGATASSTRATSATVMTLNPTISMNNTTPTMFEVDIFSYGADGKPGGSGNDADIGSWAD